jgi:hypothetical protein
LARCTASMARNLMVLTQRSSIVIGAVAEGNPAIPAGGENISR